MGHGQGVGVGTFFHSDYTMIFIDDDPILTFAHLSVAAGSAPANFSLVSGNFLSAGGAHTVTYQWQASGIFNAGISIDDLFFTAEIGSVPEPATLTLFGLGLLGLGAARRRKKRAA
jgi:hypothetical protein